MVIFAEQFSQVLRGGGQPGAVAPHQAGAICRSHRGHPQYREDDGQHDGDGAEEQYLHRVVARGVDVYSRCLVEDPILRLRAEGGELGKVACAEEEHIQYIAYLYRQKANAPSYLSAHKAVKAHYYETDPCSPISIKHRLADVRQRNRNRGNDGHYEAPYQRSTLCHRFGQGDQHTAQG